MARERSKSRSRKKSRSRNRSSDRGGRGGRRSGDRSRSRGGKRSRSAGRRSPDRSGRDKKRSRSAGRKRSDSPPRRRGRDQDRRRSPSRSRRRSPRSRSRSKRSRSRRRSPSRSRSRRRSPPRGAPPPAPQPAPGGAGGGSSTSAPPAAAGGAGAGPGPGAGGGLSSGISPVLALGNFGGRAAGIGVPGQDDAVTAYCRASNIDQRAEMCLRSLPVHLAAEVMQQGPILGANASAILMVRAHRAEQMAKNRPQVNPADLITAQLSGDPVQLFIIQNGIDMAAARSLRALSPNQQHEVMNDGSLQGMNPSALLMSRIRRVQGLPRL